MAALKPWARGPFELILHAESHLKVGSDFDKRIALISFDNAIEVTITTFLRLHPKQRGGRAYARDKVEQWLANYHSKLDFLFEDYIRGMGAPALITLDEIIWYHNLRNELYHAGNGMVPDENSLSGARAAALWIFSILFQEDAECLLRAQLLTPVPAPKKDEGILPAQMRFLQSFIRLERTLVSALQATGVVDAGTKPPTNFRKTWHSFAAQAGVVLQNYDAVISEAQKARNSLVHGRSISLSEEQLANLVVELDEISKYVNKFAFSFDILPALKKRYSQWLRPEITSVRIIQREQMVFLEIVARKGPGLDEEVTRTELSFIGREDAPMFSPIRSAYENAELLLRELDPYSIINCTDLFTPDGCKQVAETFGPHEV